MCSAGRGRSRTIVPSDLPNEIYNVPSCRRQVLPAQLGEALGTEKIPVPFWACLQVSELRLWKKLIFHGLDNPTKVTYACFNSICISPEIHRMWRMEPFALRPLEYNATVTELEVKWHWQPKQEHSIQDSVPLNKPPLSSSSLNSTKAKSNHPIYLLVEFSSEAIRRVKTEDRFVLRTEDPERLRLSSKDLFWASISFTEIGFYGWRCRSWSTISHLCPVCKPAMLRSGLTPVSQQAIGMRETLQYLSTATDASLMATHQNQANMLSKGSSCFHVYIKKSIWKEKAVPIYFYDRE